MTRLNEIDENLEERLTSLENRMDTKFTSLENRMDTRFTSLENRIDKVEISMIDLTTEVHQMKDELGGKAAFDSCIGTAVRVEIFRHDETPNKVASGSVIKYLGLYYVITCFHVLSESGKYDRFLVHLTVTDENGKEYDLKPRLTYAFGDLLSDIALIPIQPISEDMEALNTSSESLYLSQKVYSIAARSFSTVWNECNIVEKTREQNSLQRNELLSSNGFYHSNCGGANGFSGAGYVNSKGELVALHHGSGRFRNLGESPESFPEEEEEDGQKNFRALDFQWAQFKKKILSSVKSPGNTINADTIFELKKYIDMSSRNPRTVLTDTSIIWKQGMQMAIQEDWRKVLHLMNHDSGPNLKSQDKRFGDDFITFIPLMNISLQEAEEMHAKNEFTLGRTTLKKDQHHSNLDDEPLL